MVKMPSVAGEIRELRGLPTLDIVLSGGEACRGYYRVFTGRHPRWRFIQNKKWGVALASVPERPEEYRTEVSRLMRRRVKRASEAGYKVGRIDPAARIPEIMAINHSASERQGQPIHPDYLDESEVRAFHGRTGDVFGVSDADGTLCAYLTVRVCGDVAIIERLLGHVDVLDQGVMYLLIMGTMEDLIGRRRESGSPKWLMYDMFSGASEGMRDFKHVIGCRPYRVNWTWRD